MKKLSKEEMKKVVGGDESVANPGGGGGGSVCLTTDGCMVGFSCEFTDGGGGRCGLYFHATHCGCVGAN